MAPGDMILNIENAFLDSFENVHLSLLGETGGAGAEGSKLQERLKDLRKQRGALNK